MRVDQTLFAIITLALCAPLCAQGLSFSELYGSDYAARKDASGGTLTSSLKDQAPGWLDFSGSGSGLITERFRFHDGGMVITPDKDHGSCEARLDLGISEGTLSVRLIELDVGGAFGWMLRDLSDPSRAWLIEVRRDALNTAELRVRVLNRGAFRLLPDATRGIDGLELPAALRVDFNLTGLTATFAGQQSQIKLEGANGVGVGMVATDQRARVQDLSIDFTPHETWVEDATARQLARRTLQHLREHASNGMLAGIASHSHPELEAALEAYTEAQRNARQSALGAASSRRAEALAAIAEAHPKLAAAQHEAGLAALQAGSATAALSFLEAADKLYPTEITSLLLADALRRRGDYMAVLQHLRRQHDVTSEDLAPEYLLLDARTMADMGALREAQNNLALGLRRFPDHDRIQALHDSISELTEPTNVQASKLPGPLGLTVWTDMPDAQLKPILDKLTPYLELMRRWLPGLRKSLPGCIAIYSNPVDYLRTVLAITGDNLDNAAGMFALTGIKGRPTVFACRAFGEDELLRTLVHELWHRAVSIETDTPDHWLNEGMAVYLSAGRLEGGVLIFDRLPTEFGTDAPHHNLTAECFKRAFAAGRDFYDAAHVHRNYLAAWAMVWFLAESDHAPLLAEMLHSKDAALLEFNEGMDALIEKMLAAVTKVK